MLKRILIVERDSELQMLFRHALKSRDCDIDFASSFREFKRLAGGAHLYDAIFSDVRLPDEPTSVVCKFIGSLAPEHEHLCILSSDNSGEALGSKLGVPFSKKPILPSELLRRYDQLTDIAV